MPPVARRHTRRLLRPSVRTRPFVAFASTLCNRVFYDHSTLILEWPAETNAVFRCRICMPGLCVSSRRTEMKQRRSNANDPPRVDVVVQCQGKFTRLTLQSDAALEWIWDHV